MKKTTPHKNHSFAVLIAFLALCLIGGALSFRLSLQLMPTRGLPALSVNFYWYNASPEMLELEATSKFEAAFAGIQNVKKIKSTSSEGYAHITISFKSKTDMPTARFAVANKIHQLHSQLPHGISYPTIGKASGENKKTVLSYAVNAPDIPSRIEAQLRKAISNDLNNVIGLNSWNIYGATPNEWVIRYRANRMQHLGVKLQEVQSALRNYFSQHQLGQVNVLSKAGSKPTHMVLVARNAQKLDWKKIPIKLSDNKIIHLGQIIESARLHEKAPSSYFRINGLNSVNLVLYADSKSNIIELTERLRTTIEAHAQLLPKGYSLKNSYDASLALQRELTKNLIRASLSLTILFLFIIVSTRKWRYLVLISSSIACSMFIAFGMYYLLGIEIQLYSLAGITISFGMLIDNSLIMIDHFSKTRQRNVFLPILAATLTTVGSLVVVFFLEEKQRLNLIDFTWVIVINLTVSLFTALFFIPALMYYFPLKSSKQVKKRTHSGRRIGRKILQFYGSFIGFNRKFWFVYFVLAIWLFGFPLYLLPEKMNKETTFAKAYNATIGSDYYQQKLKKNTEKWLGGSLSLFSKHVYEKSHYGKPERTSIHIRAAMADGCTTEQINELMKNMENFLSSFHEIENYQTTVNAYNDASILVYFKPEFENSSFPYLLKHRASSKAISWGGADWSIVGVGKPFNNAVHTNFVNKYFVLEGYNYTDLWYYAVQLKQQIAKNDRVENLTIESRISWRPEATTQYNVQFRFQNMVLLQHTPHGFYSSLQQQLNRSRLLQVLYKGQATDLILESNKSNSFDLWHLTNQSIPVNNKNARLLQLATIEKQKTTIPIRKKNQQYNLVVAFNFTGPEKLAEHFMNKELIIINQKLPTGYRASLFEWSGWNSKEKKQYYLIGVVLLIIFFICSILFESLWQAIAIVSLIPISFIGVFATFYFGGFRFDQGGFASFVLLAGLTVNAGIYLLAEYNRLHKLHKTRELTTYLLAFKNKASVVLLTILSTVLGLVPFIVSGQNELFWFAFAVGAIGGLIFSLLALLVFLPIWVVRK